MNKILNYELILNYDAGGRYQCPATVSQFFIKIIKASFCRFYVVFGTEESVIGSLNGQRCKVFDRHPGSCLLYGKDD